MRGPDSIADKFPPTSEESPIFLYHGVDFHEYANQYPIKHDIRKLSITPSLPAFVSPVGADRSYFFQPSFRGLAPVTTSSRTTTWLSNAQASCSTSAAKFATVSSSRTFSTVQLKPMSEYMHYQYHSHLQHSPTASNSLTDSK